MLDNSVALEKLVTSLAGRKRLQRLKCYCVDGGFYGLLFFLLITITRIFEPIKILPINNYLWELGLVLAVAVIFAAVWALARPINRQRLLINTDRRLGLEERLSTANEYLKKEGDNLFSPLLIKDAVARTARTLKARNIEKSRLYKVVYTGRLKYYPLLIAGILILSILKPGLAATDELMDLGQRIESSSRLLAARKGLEDPLFEEMRRFGEELQKGRVAEQEALERAAEMAELMQQRIENLERTSLSAEQNEGADVPKQPGDEGGISELEKELMDLQATELQTLYQQEQSESDLMHSKPGESEQAEVLAEIEDLSALRELLNNFMSAQKGKMGLSTPSDSMAGDSLKEEGEESLEPKGATGAAGNEKVEDQKDRAKPLLKSSSQGVSRVEGAADWEETKKIFLRSLPPGGESTIPEEKKLIDFRREIEEVIRKEEVPLNYREYIKDYFLKINIIQD